MRFYFNDEQPYKRCVICGEYAYDEEGYYVSRNDNYHRPLNLDYCGMCDEWFCRKGCAKRWDLRGEAAMIRKTRRLSSNLRRFF